MNGFTGAMKDSWLKEKENKDVKENNSKADTGKDMAITEVLMNDQASSPWLQIRLNLPNSEDTWLQAWEFEQHTMKGFLINIKDIMSHK